MTASLDSIQTWGALHQVWFVRDYYMLKFEDFQTINIYNSSTLSIASGVQIAYGEPGFCDGLVKCIEARVDDVAYVPKHHLSIVFDNGATLSVLLDPASFGSSGEAFEVTSGKDLAGYVEFKN